MTRTRYKELGLIKQASNCWRFIDLTDDPNGDKLTVVGEQYRTKMEALCDLARYAREYGCENA